MWSRRWIPSVRVTCCIVFRSRRARGRSFQSACTRSCLPHISTPAPRQWTSSQAEASQPRTIPPHCKRSAVWSGSAQNCRLSPKLRQPSAPWVLLTLEIRRVEWKGFAIVVFVIVVVVIDAQRAKQQFIFLTQQKSRFAWLRPFVILDHNSSRACNHNALWHLTS